MRQEGGSENEKPLLVLWVGRDSGENESVYKRLGSHPVKLVGADRAEGHEADTLS